MFGPNDGKMLHVFAQANAARMRTHRNFELHRHQNNGEILIHTRKTAAVNLASINVRVVPGGCTGNFSSEPSAC
jgi:hypothetical protein